MAGVVRIVGKIAAASLVVPLILLSGCGDDEVQKAIGDYQKAAGVLASTYQTMVTTANTIQEEQYLDQVTASSAPFDRKAMLATALYTPEEIALRKQAVVTLGSYMVALAALEAGNSAAKLETDAGTASTNVATLGTDAGASIANKTGKALEDFSGPVSTAISAAGTVLKLIEERHGRAEVKKSVLENDGAIEALFELIEKESHELYSLEQTALVTQQGTLVTAFDAESKRNAGATGSPGLVALGERLKELRKKQALQAQADPAAAVKAFKKSHDDLIALMKAGTAGEKKKSISALASSATIFSAEVGPLATNVQTLAINF